jgi:hypothetical protein
MVKNVLWKYDSVLGIAFFCPTCKTFVCGGEKCNKCGQKLNWNNKDKYSGKVNWE